MRDEIPILGGKRDRAYALDLAAAHVPLINSAFAAHDECRRDTTEQIRKEVERGLAEDPPHGGNALFLALKEMELAMHSQAMAAAINTLALLAALGVPVPMPLNQDKPDGEVMN